MAAEPAVFVVDDDQAMRDSLHWLMTSVNLPVKAFASAREFLDAFQPDWLGCLLLDVRMPEMSGLELQKEMSARSVDLPIIIITGHGDVQMAVNAMKSGVFDFIEKPFTDQTLLDLVHKAMQQSVRLADKHAEEAETRRRVDLLTPREREVLGMVIVGETNRSIACHLGIGKKTVEAHRAKVMHKMQAKSLASLMKICITLDLNQGKTTL